MYKNWEPVETALLVKYEGIKSLIKIFEQWCTYGTSHDLSERLRFSITIRCPVWKWNMLLRYKLWKYNTRNLKENTIVTYYNSMVYDETVSFTVCRRSSSAIESFIISSTAPSLDE